MSIELRHHFTLNSSVRWYFYFRTLYMLSRIIDIFYFISIFMKIHVGDVTPDIKNDLRLI